LKEFHNGFVFGISIRVIAWESSTSTKPLADCSTSETPVKFAP
jgi:hypothetical protein